MTRTSSKTNSYKYKVHNFWIIILVLSIRIEVNQANYKYSGVTKALFAKTNITWTIQRFSTLAKLTSKGQFLSSNMISPPSITDTKFLLYIYPSGHPSNAHDGFISMYLAATSAKFDSASQNMSIEVLKNSNEKILQRISRPEWSHTGRGWRDFAMKDYIFDKKHNILTKNDELRFFISVEAYNGWDSYNDECKRSDNSGKRYFSKITKLYKTKEYSDFSFLVNGVKIPAHKIIFQAVSPVLANIFKQDKKKDGSFTLAVDDIKLDIMKELLNFVYSAKIPDNIDNIAEDLLHAADSFDIDILREVCELYIYQKINIKNVYNILNMAIKYKAPRLKSRAIEYIASHSGDIISEKSFEPAMKKGQDCIGKALTKKL